MRTVLARLAAAMLAATLCAAGLSAPGRAQDKILYLFNWQDYIPARLIQAFEAQCGCKVVQSYYDSNAALAAKLRVGGDAQYDVVVPSSYYVPQLVQEGLIRPLDRQQLPNFKNLLPRFQDPVYDRHDAHSIPYQWGTTGIAYLRTRLANLPDSWSALFDPRVNPAYPFALMGGSGRDTIGAACAYLGYGFTCDKTSEWIAAAKLIERTMQRPNFTGFVDGDPAVKQLKAGVIAVGMTFNGEVAQCHADNSCGNVGYIVPRQGTEIWADTMAIPMHAPHPRLAYDFINFILSARGGAELSNYNLYASPNAASTPYLNPQVAAPLVTPTAEQLRQLHVLPPLAGRQLQEFNAIWTAVRQH